MRWWIAGDSEIGYLLFQIHRPEVELRLHFFPHQVTSVLKSESDTEISASMTAKSDMGRNVLCAPGLLITRAVATLTLSEMI